MSDHIANKVIFDGNVLIDVSTDTVAQDKVLYGYTFHYKDGTTKAGTCTYDANTSDATASASEILATKTAYVNGTKLTGEMTNRGSVTGTISGKADEYTVQAGYHDGGGKVSISSTEQAKIIAGNIKSGVTILGVEGSYTGEAIAVQANKNATPSSSEQVILPDSPNDYLAQVTVAAIPYEETLNSAGGYTVTIG